MTTRAIRGATPRRISAPETDGPGQNEARDFDFSSWVPVPVPCALAVTEGSPRVLLASDGQGQGNCGPLLSRGNSIRIHHPHWSDDWTISSDPDDAFSEREITLTRPYNHSSIVERAAALDYDPVERLHSPYKNKVSPSKLGNPCETSNTQTEDSLLRCGREGGALISLSTTRVWKLVPISCDKRPAWRKQYDDGGAPWSNDFSNPRDLIRRFGVNIKWSKIEESCRDAQYAPESSIHQQRVTYVEKVPPARLIDETYKTVCHWHPVSSSVDNVKWAKLARKMRFLATVRNSSHEVDMAFLRQSCDRKLGLEGFGAILRDIASIQYPKLDAEEALHKVLWTTVIMLPQVNQMVWREAKRMAMMTEADRLCAQMKVAAVFRRVQQRARYVCAVNGATCVAKYSRRLIAIAKRKSIMAIILQDYIFRRRFQCATLCQKVWRMFYSRKQFLERKARIRELEQKKLHERRCRLKTDRRKREALILLRQTLRIQGTLVIVTMLFSDARHKVDQSSGSSLEMLVYERTMQKTFAFSLEEPLLRECMQAALGSDGPLSWNEMLDPKSLAFLTDRLMVRMANGLPSIVFSRRNLVEKGTLISKKLTRLNDPGGLYVVSIYRSSSDFVVSTYEPSTCGRLKIRLSSQDLCDWLRDDEQLQQRRAKFSSASGKATKLCGPVLLQPQWQDELIAWLSKRVLVERNEKTGESKRLLLQCEADEAKEESMAIKIQSIVRRVAAERRAQSFVQCQYEKVFDREHGIFCYVNTASGVRQWEKPNLLGDKDLDDPPDEWRRIEQNADVYYHNPATGQTSWLSEQDAARMVQRRIRHRQALDVMGSKLDFATCVNAVKFIRDTEVNFDKHPEKLSHSVNYALLCHCLRFDFNRARSLYKDAIQKSPHHPVITRAYGIFILAACDSPRAQTFERSCKIFKEAETRDVTACMFQAAIENCFRWAVLAYPSNPLALLNYALLHQCVLGDYNRAEKIYRRALAVDATNTNVAQNFALFQEQRYPGGVYAGVGPPASVVGRSNIVDERLEWGEWICMVDPMCPNPAFGSFWYDTLKKLTRFDDPDWQAVWEERVRRSRSVSGAGNKKQVIEYYDESLGVNFYYSRLTDEYFTRHQ